MTRLDRAGCLAFVLVCGVCTPPPAHAQDASVVDVPVDVNRRLPQVWILPGDAASVAAAESLAKVLAVAGLYEPTMGKPGQTETGLSVLVKASSAPAAGDVIVETIAVQPTTKQRTRRVGELVAATRAVDLARIADGVILDLTGRRSHLSGSILFTDLSSPGHRVVRASLATGQDQRLVSPPEAFARGADFGPGGRVYYAMSRAGEPLKVYAEGDATPLALPISEHVETIAISPAGDRIALVVGARSGSAVVQGPFPSGPLEVASTEELAVEPAYGPDGSLVYSAGPAKGPLRVVVAGKAASPPGVWATSPSYCGPSTDQRVVYGSTDGVIRLSSRGATSVVAHGQSPVCSPDGRTVLFSREGATPGIYAVGLEGVTPTRIHVGAAANLRWAPGRPLPPAG